jgi:hypothetical protein
MARQRSILIGISLLALSACASSGTDGASGGGTSHVSKADMGRQWPLTVDSGVLACSGSSGAGEVTFRAPDGTTYAVNGLAKSGGNADIRPIWAPDRSMGPAMGMKKNISPLIERGLRLCS